MRVIARKAINDFYLKHPQAEQPLLAWYHEVRKAQWKNSNEVKAQYATASILKNGRVVFNIKGNDYRLVVKINFSAEIIFIRFVGTQKEYNKIDVNAI